MAAEAGPRLRVEVVLALPERQILHEHRVPAGTRLLELVLASGILKAVPELEPQTLGWAIHGRLAAADTLLREGDRIEILRPLRVDPKQARRRRQQRKPAP